MAERVGFEPTVEFPLHSLSRRALSTAQTPLRSVCSSVRLAKAFGSHNGEGRGPYPWRLLRLSPCLEEMFQDGGGFFGEHTTRDFHAMIELRMIEHAEA
jgi:hypothetical protein